jgi:RNA polymerase sigma factor (sigma-70 family)
MNTSSLRCVLRHAKSLTGDSLAWGDAKLLQRYSEAGDEEAFAALVGRHGPMVWGVCRNLLPAESDADDAFQATFLTFIRCAPTIRQGDGLAGWLHRVAYRVALKARRSARRRRGRERAAAVAERANAVPESGWDQLLAAVHEEVNRLPDSLRLPFVLCCLEGRRPSDAAAALNLKSGTFTGRLTRARQRVLDRLARRGLPIAAVAGSMALATATGSAAVPAALVAKAVHLSGTSSAIPSTILQLSLGVMEMNMTRTKLIGAALLVSGLLVVGVGPVLVPWASAQPAPKAAPEKPDPAPTQARPLSLVKWEYSYIEAPRPLTQRDFESACRNIEPGGWEYCGTQEMILERGGDKETDKRRPETVLVFKRPVRGERLKSGAGLSAAWQIEREGTVYVPARELAPPRATKTWNETVERPPTLGTGSKSVPAAGNLQPSNLDEEARTQYADWARGRKNLASIEIMPLEEASAEKMAKLLTELFAQQGTFQADERSNSLVIKTDAKTLDAVRALIERLDKQAAMRRQRDKERYEPRRNNPVP